MIEFGILNINTQEERIIFGYNGIDAFRRYNLDAAGWKVLYSEYVNKKKIKLGLDKPQSSCYN